MPGPMHTGRTRTGRRDLPHGERHETEQQPAPVEPQPVAGLVHDVVRQEATGDAADPLGGTAVDGDVAEALRRRSGGGKQLTGSFASALGEQYGADLSSVRVHDDDGADRLSRSMQAVAFTHGTDMYFTKGSYDPQSESGQRLIAHEAAHVVQGHAGRATHPGSAPVIGRADDPLEAEADVMADTALAAIRSQATVSEGAVAGHGAGCGDCVPGGAIHRRVAAGADLGAVRRQATLKPVGAPVIRRKGFFSKLFDKITGKKPEPQQETPQQQTTPEPTPEPTPTPGWTKTGVSDSVTGQKQGPQLGKAREYPMTVTIGKEQVSVASLAEEKEAGAIIAELWTTYGVRIDSAKTVAGIESQYTDVLVEELAKLQADVWDMKELRGLLAAIGFYAPIMGKNRATSSLAKRSQGVTSIGKLKNAIDKNTVDGALDDSTLGEYFSGKKNFGMFGAVTDYVDDDIIAEGKTEGDNSTGILATAIHEMAHGLVQPYQLGNWIKKLDFWLDRSTKSGDVNAEAPPTDYGNKSAAEDLCESVAMYFINEPMLRASCPKRADFIKKVVEGWTPKETVQVIESAKNPTGSEPVGA